MPNQLVKGRVWLFVGAILSILVGVGSVMQPGLASVAIEQILGVFCTASGIVLLVASIFGKYPHHRFLSIVSALLRIIVGVVLMSNVVAGVLALTIVLASLFVAEGLIGVIFALRLKERNPAWIWILLNAVIALFLGGLLIVRFPSDAFWVLGLLFGINCLFLGFSLLTLGLSLPELEKKA